MNFLFPNNVLLYLLLQPMIIENYNYDLIIYQFLLFNNYNSDFMSYI